jgi:hypothetical protein
MEFEELQKIWDMQNNQPLYAINENALHNRIVSKKDHINHIARFSEWLLIITNTAAGIIILGSSIFSNHKHIIFMYLLAAWMFASALYALVNRIRRISEQQRFDRSMLGDLQHAMAAASYQVRLSGIMRWNIFPIGVLILLSFWETGKQGWIALVIAPFIILVFYASRWEHKIYKSKKHELEILLKKLQQV